MSPDDEAFLEQVAVELYDEEVDRHPEGITYEQARANVMPRWLAILDSVRRTA